MKLGRSFQSGHHSPNDSGEHHRGKNNLSKLIKKVRHGESVLILDRSIPVARLEPLPLGSSEADEARLAELERQSLLKRGKGKLPKDFWTRPRPKLKGSAVDALLQERKEARW